MSTGCPLRDEIEVNVSQRTPGWRAQATATVRIPIANGLRAEGESNWRGLRRYALEPARQAAFSVMHALHHELRHQADLSRYFFTKEALAPGSNDNLLVALKKIEIGLARMLMLDTVFGGGGVSPPFLTERLHHAIELASELCEGLRRQAFHPPEALTKAEIIMQAVEIVPMASAIYHLSRGRWLLREPGVSEVSPLAAALPADSHPSHFELAAGSTPS